MGFVYRNGRSGDRWRIGLWIVTGAAVASAPLALWGEQRQRPRAKLPQPGGHVAAGKGAGPAATIRYVGGPVLAGSPASFLLLGRARSTTAWQFGARGVVLAQGRVELDRDGVGRCRLAMPAVRHRQRCRFVIPSLRRPVASHDVVVYPARMLSSANKALSALGIGVLDPAGRIAGALAAEKVACRPLRTQLQEEAFDGDMLILGGVQRATALTERCRKFHRRIREGMIAIVINPPARWRAFGIKRVELKPPVAAFAAPAKNFASMLHAGDLGLGPWTSALRSTGSAKALIWIAPRPAASRPGSATSRPSRPARKQLLLILAQRMDKGWVITALLPQLADPAGNAVGRAALDEVILWVLAQKAAQQRRRKE